VSRQGQLDTAFTVETRSLGTQVVNIPLYKARMTDMYGALVEWELAVKTEVSGDTTSSCFVHHKSHKNWPGAHIVTPCSSERHSLSSADISYGMLETEREFKQNGCLKSARNPI
jgi:hypothetical protein